MYRVATGTYLRISKALDQPLRVINVKEGNKHWMQTVVSPHWRGGGQYPCNSWLGSPFEACPIFYEE